MLKNPPNRFRLMAAFKNTSAVMGGLLNVLALKIIFSEIHRMKNHKLRGFVIFGSKLKVVVKYLKKVVFNLNWKHFYTSDCALASLSLIALLQRPTLHINIYSLVWRSERQERGGPCRLLKLWWMGTQRVHMKGVIPWLVPYACRAGTTDFCSALVALVGPVQKYFFPYR